ncbi:gamma-glutamyl-gamma-aminobutyrate hydrolase family protein [Pseudoduganella sp. LjRoot289]|uniref:gamma-glutamyl-gamma-aminobutyrate hydrolase family protein n=1 Tax=Pseudoduganella sp. LjRoot289 TaxID=3342314 RepID=UPI003ED12A85
MRRPLVIVPACTRHIGSHPDHAVHSKYIDAVVQGARCMPLILPALGGQTDLEGVLAAADGIMLTGSASNVQAILYGQEVLNLELPQDHARDATTLPLIRAAIKRGIPLLAICRGFQEVNVALGGTLHQAVHEVPGMMDHRDNPQDTLEKQYGAAHRVRLAADGKLAAILDGAQEIMVNSLHGQGVDRLAPGLVAEATADDGLVEAYTVATAPAFTLAVQWHPEWQLDANQDSIRIFRAFGLACRTYQERIP